MKTKNVKHYLFNKNVCLKYFVKHQFKLYFLQFASSAYSTEYRITSKKNQKKIIDDWIIKLNPQKATD